MFLISRIAYKKEKDRESVNSENFQGKSEEIDEIKKGEKSVSDQMNETNC